MTTMKGGLSSARSLVVLDFLIKNIQSGRYVENQKLPTERELADICNVSRSSVREALSVLAALGIVERRVGNGTYVRSRNENLLSVALQITASSELRDIFELQRILEVGAAELAARRMDMQYLANLRVALAKMERAATQGDVATYFAADREFHTNIAVATGNRLLYQHVLALLDQMDRPLWRIVKSYFIKCQNTYVKQSVAMHRRLLAALEARDTAQARRVMEEHFERVEDEIFGVDEEEKGGERG
ncbi:MAG: FadR/GntR family transcriptional regulator [Candidatus Methanosuratincola sp.]